MSKVWLITGASRGIGLEMARAALNAGEQVAATARSTESIATKLGTGGDRLLPVELDLANEGASEAVVSAVTKRFGRVDVLVNNAGYARLGMFEEVSSTDIEHQYRVNVFGTMDMTRATLPVMRRQRSGHIFTVTSIGGLRGTPFASIYNSTKFALEGWSEALAQEIAPFGIHITIVEPGAFRTDFLESSSVRYSEASIDDYAKSTSDRRNFFDNLNRNQAGDPVKLASALLQLAAEDHPPLHFLAGTDAIGVLERRMEQDRTQLTRWRELSASTDLTAVGQAV